jgi:hypothetical protein
MTSTHLHDLLPRHKSDFDHAQAIVELGHPAVAPVLRDLLTWLQDGNWPISRPIGTFLVSIGEPMIPLIREVFQGNDTIWKYWCIDRLILEFPKELAEQFRPELERFAYQPSVDEKHEELDERAQVALERMNPRS